MCIDSKKINLDIGNLIISTIPLENDSIIYSEIMSMYSSAVTSVKNNIEFFHNNFISNYNYTLISNVESRIKSYNSIVNKMKKRNLNLTFKEMLLNINDIGGVKIICPTLQDTSLIINYLKNQYANYIDIEKDYITNPKNSGYSSYHIRIKIPVSFPECNIFIKVEIQIFTQAMHLWNYLEHDYRYKGTTSLSFEENKSWVELSKFLRNFDKQISELNMFPFMDFYE